MKQIFQYITVLAASALALTGCSAASDTISDENLTTASSECNVSFGVDNATRVEYETVEGDGVGVKWADGDIIYIATSDGTWGSGYKTDAVKPKIFTYNAATRLFEGDATLTAGKSYTFRAQYCQADQRTYLLSTQSSNKLLAAQTQTSAAMSDMRAYDYMAAQTTATVGTTTVPTFSMRHLYSFVRVRVENLSSSDVTLASVQLQIPDQMLASVCYFDITTMAITSTVAKYDSDTIDLTVSNVTIKAGSVGYAYMVVAPIASYSGTVKLTATMGDGVTYDGSKTVTNLTLARATMNTATITIPADQSDGDTGGYEEGVGDEEGPTIAVADIAGQWHIAQWNGEAVDTAQMDIYMEFNADNTMRLCQLLTSHDYVTVSGTYAIEGNRLTGTYDGVGEWNRSYRMFMNDDKSQLTMTTINSSEVCIYERGTFPTTAAKLAAKSARSYSLSLFL